MASLLINYERLIPNTSTEEDDDELKNSKLQNKTLNKFEINYRLPRHVRYLIEKKDFKQIFDIATLNATNNTNAAKYNNKHVIGEPYLLDIQEDFPLLGSLNAGEIQSVFKNELFKAPVYSHKPSTTDFLLVRIKLKDTLTYTLRNIKNILVSGQTEPVEIVPKPSKNLTKTQENFFLLACIRYLTANPNGVEWNDLSKELIRSSYGREKVFEALLPRIARSEKYIDEYTARSRVNRWVLNNEVDAMDLEKIFTPKEGKSIYRYNVEYHLC
jgi:Protein of unknown function (DUF3591)